MIAGVAGALATAVTVPTAAAAHQGASPVAVTAQPASRPVILDPQPGAQLCAGNALIAGEETNATLARRAGTATWSFISAGRPTPVNPRPALADTLAAGLHAGTWATRSAPSGPGLLRLTLSYGSVRGTAIRPVTVFRGPVLGPILAKYNPETGETTLSVPGAIDQDGHIVRMNWYLGDGTVLTGPSVVHTYAKGKYVVAVQAIDDHGCTTTRYGEEDQPPLHANAVLAPVKFCDPLSIEVPPGKRVAGAGPVVVAYVWHVAYKVFGDPALCNAAQFIKGQWIQDVKDPDGTTDIQVFERGKDGKLASDGDDTADSPATGTIEPNADGTAVDTFDGVIGVTQLPARGPQVINAQIKAEVLDEITGQEAPIAHEENESDAKGETAWFSFKFCVALNPPAGTKNDSFDRFGRAEPDAALPTAAEKKNRADGPLTQIHPDPLPKIDGCGK